MFSDQRVVDNRTFLLGLDGLYRKAIKEHERTELLSCARTVAAVVGVAPVDVPVEGYYAEDSDLTEYFLLVRALQSVDDTGTPPVEGLRELQRLRAVTSSALYGRPQPNGKLIPASRDSLSEALLERFPDWTVTALTETAARIARELDDVSLVGLAARAREPVALAAIRESVVLYAPFMVGTALHAPKPTYVWKVDDELSRAASRFVETFNALFNETLPAPEPQNAASYWRACEDNDIDCRCVCLGRNPTAPIRYYHWALRGADVREFWHSTIWTTERYRRENPAPDS